MEDLELVVALNVDTGKPMPIDNFSQLRRVVLNSADDKSVFWPAVNKALSEANLASGTGSWWLGGITRLDSGHVLLQEADPGPGYGITADGRIVIDLGFEIITVAQFYRALREGYFVSGHQEVALVRPPNVGGNGDITRTILEWFATNMPSAFLGYVAAKASDWVLDIRDANLQKVAADWASRKIDSPARLRMWIEKKSEWFPELLGKRLGLPAPAARVLLEQLGYEEGLYGLMRVTGSPEALKKRQRWLDSEHH